MKKILEWTSIIMFLLLFLHSCVYHYMTHMNEEELEWLTNRHEGEKMYFESTDGSKDTVTIFTVEVWNSLNPFNMSYFNTSTTEYIASGCIEYCFNSETGCEGTFYVNKLHNNKPLYFSGGLLGRWSERIPLKLKKLRINNVMLNDVLFFDENNTEKIGDSNRDCPIKSYAWSKKYGLVQYTFQNGTTFIRIDI